MLHDQAALEIAGRMLGRSEDTDLMQGEEPLIALILRGFPMSGLAGQLLSRVVQGL